MTSFTGISAFLPEILLLAVGALVLASEFVRSGGAVAAATRSYHLAWAGLALVLALQAFVPHGFTPGTDGGGVAFAGSIFGGWSTSHPIGLWKQVFTLAALGTVLFSRPFFLAGGSARGILTRPGAFYGLLALCTFGMFALVSARDLLTFYLGLELATLPLYALAAFQPKDSASAEAGSKYILFGGLSSALTLFGLSFLYGVSGSLSLDALGVAAEADPSNPILSAGLFFILGGLGFKLSMAPLHMWAPDVYEGAPTPVMAFLSVASKAAAVGALATLFLGPLQPVRNDLGGVFSVAAILSMVVGNLGAMRQANLRRFIAYSSIAQVGYMLVALLGEAEPARVALLYNLAAYGVTSFALYFVVGIVGRDRPETLSSLRGLSRRQPGLAALLALAMFSMAGIPPLAGFLGKFLLFSAAAATGHYILVGVAVVNAVVSFYYYMQLVKQAYITAETDGAPADPILLTIGEKIWMWALSGLLLILGLSPFLLTYLGAR